MSNNTAKDSKKSEILMGNEYFLSPILADICKTGNVPSCYLISVDLEDIRTQVKDGYRYPNRIPEMVEKYLSFFNEHHTKITFFVVGEAIKEIKSLIREIISSGHEIGCHTYNHTQLDKLNPEKFRDNLLRNIETLKNLGAIGIKGFRAPDFSLINSTKWAWDVLAELGFKYSSSVLPARNPIYGWEGFSWTPIRLPNGIWELPISVTQIPGLKIPFVGGVYLRALPKSAILHFCKWYTKRSFPLIGYVHPYDIDEDQERFKVEDNLFYDWLVYYNRKSTLIKLSALLKKIPTQRFIDYVQILEKYYKKD